MEKEITIDDLEKQTGVTPDIVAARSRSYTFQGKPLKVFSKSRCSAAKYLGNAILLGRAQVDKNNIWPELSFDSQMVLWLCSVDDSRVTRVYLDREKAIAEMSQWWEENGGWPGSDIETEAASILLMICEDILTVSATAEAPTGGRDTSSLGE